nr:PREDICTED: cadherin-related tumor suppressor [Bemisia tabaci]
MLCVRRRCIAGCLILVQCLVIAAQGPGPGPAKKRSPMIPGDTQMQSRAVDTRIQLDVLEGQPRGTIVGSIPIKSGFTYRFNEPPREFTLNSTTGEIRTTVVLDREQLVNDRFDLVILSSQPTYPIEVRIVVIDVNDNAPEFPEPSISVSFSESAAAGTKLLLDAATDRDSGPNGVTENYKIVAGNTNEKFRLEVTAYGKGEVFTYLHLQTTGKLDRETQAFYQLNISAEDGGTPVRHGYLQVNVTILDVNDNPPIFDHSDYSVSLNESVPPGTKALQVLATDSDIGDNAKITYYLSESERKFTVDPDSGEIFTSEKLDCPYQNCPQTLQQKAGSGCPKSCVFTVFARDHGSPRQDGRTYVTVNLVDANDHNPMIKFRYFPSTAGQATVDENALNGSVVAAVSVVDPDEGSNGETTVEIRSGNEMNHFRLESTQSFDIVRVNGILDREHINKYNLTIVATDKGSPPRTATAFLIIHVNDVNDHEPVFEKSEYSVILSELSPPGTYVAGIKAADEDSGVNAEIFYSFVSGNDQQWFDIDMHTGLVVTKKALDREKQGTVELKVSARDGGPNPKWSFTQLKVMILDENDERPQFSQEHLNVSFSENTPANTLIAMLTASDHDQGTNGSVTYGLLPEIEQLYPDMFYLDSLTGQLTTRSKLDREEISSYEIKVIAKDQGIPPQSSTATVSLNVLDVNDNSPEFYPLLYVIRVKENTEVGTSILQVVATDKDEGENAVINYAIESGSDGFFQIDPKTGNISLKAPLTKSSKIFFSLRVSARDKGDKKAMEDAVVEIIKDEHVENLEFDHPTGYSFQITEDHSNEETAMKNREVGRVKVRLEGQHKTEPPRYKIVFGDPKMNFEIDERSGLIRTAKLIDREAVSAYSLNVIARSGLMYGKTSVNITVLDVNDNEPVFMQKKDQIRIPENAAVGQEVFLARAKDKDAGINSRVTYSLSSDPADQFRIFEATGVVSLNRPIHAEAGTVLHLEVTATDSGEPALSSKQSVSVIIEDVNDHTPVFDHTSYETSLLESTPVNDRFFALAASDADLGENAKISYTISEGNAEGKFGVFPDGFMYVKSALDRETRDYYSLVVTATDHGKPPRSSIVPVVIHVIDENDNRPEFTNSTFNFRIKENEPPDSFVGKLTATDLDIGRNAELTFSLSDSKNDFVIDPRNGFIKTLHVFDRENLIQVSGQNFVSFEAIVSDNGLTRLRDKVRVNVYITDVNDNAPQFLRQPYKVQLSEGSSIGTQVVRVFTTDLDEGLNGDVFYLLSKGNEEECFAIDEATGQLSVVKMLDRETTSRFVLQVIAHDAALNGQLSSTATIVVDILDENDNAPEFTETESKISVLENTPIGSKLIQFQASDADLGVNSEIVFSIGSGNRRDTFHVDPVTGALFLHKKLDYEEITSYVLNITASDGGNPRLSTTIMFTVAVEDCNDNAPAFPNTAFVRQITENIPINTPITAATAEDPDSSINGKITYAITKQEPEDIHHPGRFHFQINPKTGVIHTLLPIDRELVDTFRLTVLATDQALPESTRLSAEKLVTVIVVDVNDNAPSFVSMNAAVLPSPSNDNRLVMNVLARDPDSSTNGLVTYDLVSGNTDLFRLDRTTGAVTLRNPIRHPEPRYQIAVKATDEAVQSDRKSSDAYITVFAVGPKNGLVFENEEYGANVYENQPPGTSVLTVRAELKDNKFAQIEYYITNVTGQGGRQVDRFFDVDTKLGIISTADVLDREAGSDWYIVEIYAIVTNAREPQTEKTKIRITVLDRNDSPPSFEGMLLEYSVSEDIPSGQIVTVLHATDPDLPGPITYSLVSGDDGHFDLDSMTGTLRLKEALDRETKDVYKLKVRASDGVQTTDTIITITVTDTNDNAPVFEEATYSFDVPENWVRGARVGQVQAVDEDQDVNGLVTYSVISDWANDVFSLNPQTGVFTLTARLDYEEVQHYIFVVQAQDTGKPSLSSTLTVYFNVLDLNDNAPLFDPMSYSNEVFENATIGTSIVTVTATDLDSGDNGRLEYSISSGDDEGDLWIDPNNGTIVTQRLLDREVKSLYNLVVVVSDQAKPPQQRLSSSVQVTILLKDVNDKAPEFITPNETAVLENIPINTVVLAVKAIDKDEGRNSYVEYSLLPEGSAQGIFSLGPVDGLLRVSGRLDRESRANYTLEIRAKDRGDPPKSTRTKILVRVLDENDNSPVFDPKQYSASIAENASIGASVLQVSATDEDEGINGRVRYAIVAGDENRDFIISEDTGVVRVAKNLNFERKSRYVLTVRAEDCAGNSEDSVRHDTASIAISISDINDNPPTFLDSPYLAYVMENVIPSPSGHVLTVAAFDADTQPFNAQVRYFLKEGDADLFRINASSGEITLLRALDREKQSEYILTLVAMDTGTPPLTGSGTVRVIVQDLNDHSPHFERQMYATAVMENLPVGTSVFQAVATDLDSGLNAKLRYSLLGDYIERFHINETNGLITTTTILNREEISVYYLTLIAQDCSITEPRATAVNITLTILDDNDNAPQFSSGHYTIHISDPTQPGNFVFGAKATDNDSGANSRITYFLSGKDANKFSINQETGVIRAAEELRSYDRDEESMVYHVEILAKDGGKEPKSAQAALVIKLKSSHLFPYITAPKKTKFSLAEDVPAGKVITKIAASSPKQGGVKNIRFAIAGGNIGNALRMDANTGEVLVAGSGLDYETSSQYEVWVEARDSDTPPLRSVIQLLINVTDANDNAPIIESSLYNLSVLEEEFPQQKVVTIRAHDVDSGLNGKISYRLNDDREGAFSIDSETGEIFTNIRLDREEISSYELIVEAFDHGTPQLTGSSTVLVNVLDKNDNPPRFTRLFSVNVTENAEPGSFVIKVTSSDQDIGENANATYSFTENPSRKFAIDPLTGNVTVIGHLDRETQDEYLLKVAAVDGSWRAETPLTITIQDQNDNAPEFEHSFYSFNFPELQRNIVFVGQVIATDRDKQGPNSVISYSLKHPSDLFSVDPASGEIFSKRTLKYKFSGMDSSPENQYPFTVVATDNGKPPMSSECLVTVNVVDANNNPPKFEEKEYFSPVPESLSIGQNILQVKAEDKQDYGINAEIEYFMINGTDTPYFKVDKHTGWISLSKSLDSSIIGKKQFSFTVKAVDKGVPPLSDTANINLIVAGENRHAPVFTVLSYQVIVPENEPLGTVIVTLNATDMDDGPNGIVRYAISSGNNKKKFAINATSGAISIVEALDFDTENEYHLNITAKDLGFEPKEAKGMLNIILTDVNDNPPAFNQTSYEAYVPENSPPKTVIFQVKAHDIDSPKNAIIQYSIVGGTGKDLFTIDASNGIIISKQPFDFEEKNLFTLDILAVNPDSPMFGSTKIFVHVTGVNEFYPRFNQSAFHFDVSESTEVGTSIGTIQAIDEDGGEDGKVYYLLVGSSNDKGFAINPVTGVLSVSRRLDRETQNRVILTIMAKNRGGIRGNDTAEAQVTVIIQDGNDPPEFLEQVYETKLSEAAPVGSKVITVRATDKDVKPQNNQFSYSIIGGNSERAFKIDAQNGDIETISILDREQVSSYELIIGAIDVGSPPETGSATVKITITDVNDNGPMFDPPNVVGYITENELPNTSIMTLNAVDADLPPNGAPFTYRLVGGRHKELVSIEPKTGVVKTTRVIDRESTPQIDILVSVEDSGEPRMKSVHPISITVLDQNDTPSSPRSVLVLIHVFNDIFPVGKIADVHPNDPDLTGDYQCKLMNSPAARGVLSISSGCSLQASQITPGTTYTLSVSGNDGKHADVLSTVTVEFLSFYNSTIENSLTIRIENITATKFLAHHYKGFIDILKSSFDVGDQPYLYSMHEVDNGLELTFAVKESKGYKNKAKVTDILIKKRDVLQQLVNMSSVTVGYAPCQSHSCENNGVCTESIQVLEDTRITDSQPLIFTSPLVKHDYVCRCNDGFMGKHCEKRQDPCHPNPCMAGGTCTRNRYDFTCTCPPMREGKQCELERGDACSGNPCKNGGSCKESPDGSSFFCLCRPGYRGNQCETITDSCRPNPCMNGGLCVSLKPGYKCSCPNSLHGRHCEKWTYGFKELSYAIYPPLDASTNDISMIFATTKPNSLLIYNYGAQTGGRSDFVALELVHGQPVFSYGGVRTAVTSVTVPLSDRSLADGEWHKITATRNGRVISLSVSRCTENGDTCQECKPGDVSCYVDDMGPAGTLNFNNNPLYIGGLVSADPILERSGQILSDDFVGCIHSVTINGKALNLSDPIKSRGVDPKCGRSLQSPCHRGSNLLNLETSEATIQSSVCGAFAKCHDKWHTVTCSCGNSDLISPNCNEALEPITLLDGGYIEFKISENHRRMHLLESIYGGSTQWHTSALNDSRVLNKSKRFSPNLSALALQSFLTPGVSQPSKRISLMFRTTKRDGLLIYSASNKDFTSVELIGGHIVYVSQLGIASASVNMTVSDNEELSDGQWHNLTLSSQNRGLRIILDGEKVGEELDSAGIHDFLDPYLTVLAIGGVRREILSSPDVISQSFSGCLANFTVNGELQPFNGSGSIFPEVFTHGKISQGCDNPVGVGTAAIPDPLNIGITLVIFFFIILFVAILVSFVVFRLRKQKKEKSGGGHPKQNGGTTLVTGGGLGPGGDVGRTSLHDQGVPSYITENGDIIRGVAGHHLVGPELISKRYKDQDAINEIQRPQRPDIIEREVVGKSPPPRDDHHPPPPIHHPLDQPSVISVDSEMPEHYDLENASSIAPSDIDIVYHYKGYRDGGNLRKYKPSPPHLPPPSAPSYHKHQGQGHRHSPHHFPPHAPRDSPRSVVPPPPVARVESPQHQSTPLARLSPSSELSQQMPRILTLQDISGKPLQSALLATTSSSGGVGKDALHSTSERSLNSPAMSQLSGSSSRKTPGAALTAEEINRLNSRPRTSSLVSTLDAVSTGPGHHLHVPNNGDNHSSTSTDESGNDSFTCSEIEYDNGNVISEKLSDVIFTKLNAEDDMDRGRGRNSGSGTPNKPSLPSAYDEFDSSFRGSLSTLVASDDDLSHLGGPMYRPQNGSPSSIPTALGWDYLLNWGPNFESLVGVFKDIAELPDSVNGRVPNSLRLSNNSSKQSEEYV